MVNKRLYSSCHRVASGNLNINWQLYESQCRAEHSDTPQLANDQVTVIDVFDASETVHLLYWLQVHVLGLEL